jgi:hypothetical protein
MGMIPLLAVGVYGYSNRKWIEGLVTNNHELRKAEARREFEAVEARARGMLRAVGEVEEKARGVFRAVGQGSIAVQRALLSGMASSSKGLIGDHEVPSSPALKAVVPSEDDHRVPISPSHPSPVSSPAAMASILSQADCVPLPIITMASPRGGRFSTHSYTQISAQGLRIDRALPPDDQSVPGL